MLNASELEKRWSKRMAIMRNGNTACLDNRAISINLDPLSGICKHIRREYQLCHRILVSPTRYRQVLHFQRDGRRHVWSIALAPKKKKKDLASNNEPKPFDSMNLTGTLNDFTAHIEPDC